jgi:formate hydrogenlyase subunit 6/NADH:ubiquinone oxidoreductase subunit I
MAHFITEACIGCTLCARNCPVQAITGTVKQRHVINAARCVDCGVCANVCNKGAILDADGNVCAKLPKSEWLKPVVDEGECSACSMCVQACGKDALRISLPKFRGDLKVFAYLAEEKNCVGCGICAETCPLSAITMQKAVPA